MKKDLNDPSFEFIIIEHIRRIARISAGMGQGFGMAQDNMFTAVNFLEDSLAPWIADFPDAYNEMEDFKKELEESGKNKKDYHVNRKRYRILLKLLTQMGLTLELTAQGI